MKAMRMLVTGVCVAVCAAGCGREESEGPAVAGPCLILDLKNGKAESVPAAPLGAWSTADKVERLVLRQIAPGAFDMGEAGDPKSLIVDASPRHRVTLTRGYAIGVFEVTRGQWRLVMGSDVRKDGPTGADDLPVDCLTREMATRFLAALEKRFPAYAFSLPTEAEWEYACKAGGDSSGGGAWCAVNAGKAVHPVGLKSPNEWGLYDLCGNVWEWCLDVEGAYGDAPASDPVSLAQPGTSPLFAVRGGSWRNKPAVCTPTNRAFFEAEIDIVPIGLRVVARERPKESL